MDVEETIKKIMDKPELSEIPREDVEMAYSLVAKKDSSAEENIQKTRELLHSVYGAFSSRKLFVQRLRTPEWILRKHISTKERLPHYEELYKKILHGFTGTVFDLGAGVNGFSIGFVPKIKYIGVEGVGQLVDLMNLYFKKEKLKAKAIHLSLLRLNEVKKLITKEKGKKIVFLFKVLDSLESLKRDYSKELLLALTPIADKIVVSFATRSMVRRTKFKVNRNWIFHFIGDNFKITDDFEIGGERYLVFNK